MLRHVAFKPRRRLHILDRFHIMSKWSGAIGEIRRNETKQFKEANQQNILERSRWLLLKRPENLVEKQTVRMSGLLKLNLASIKGYLMREDSQWFWDYQCSQRLRKSFSTTGRSGHYKRIFGANEKSCPNATQS